MATTTEAPASITAEGPTTHTQNQADTRPEGTFGYTRAEQIEALHKLREPFKPEEIRYRPQPWCKACSNTQTYPKVCQRHHEVTCQRCKTKLTEAHICLKFIGHAEATNRLLNVDPFWDWEPLALDAQGLPQYDTNRALWVRMTVCGMTRLGYGDATGKSGANAVKEIIGDAIRNAGMRFGMALDLWTPNELEIIESGGASLEDKADASVPTNANNTPTPAGDATADRMKESVAAAAEHVQRLMRQVADPICWANANALTQIRGDAEKHQVLDHEVQGPPPGREWMPFRTLLDNRIAELKNPQRSVA